MILEKSEVVLIKLNLKLQFKNFSPKAMLKKIKVLQNIPTIAQKRQKVFGNIMSQMVTTIMNHLYSKQK